MKIFFKSVLLLACSLIALSSQASVIYGVTNTSKVNCTGAAHGLWTNSDISGGSCSNYFSIDGTFTLNNDDADSANWTAILDATALNPQSISADIYLTFSGFNDTWGTYKQEGGAAYDAATMDFFSGVMGTIDIDGTEYDIDRFVGNYAFQFGEGANAKDENEFGGSAWIQSDDMNSHHWDFNLTFTEVPEPSSILLFGLGMFGFSLARKRQQG